MIEMRQPVGERMAGLLLHRDPVFYPMVGQMLTEPRVIVAPVGAGPFFRAMQAGFEHGHVGDLGRRADYRM